MTDDADFVPGRMFHGLDGVAEVADQVIERKLRQRDIEAVAATVVEQPHLVALLAQKLDQ